MHPTLQQARRFQDLVELGERGTPYMYGSIFSDTGLRARSLSRKKFKLLRNIDEALRRMLRPEERVHFVTFGSNVSFWESYFLGWIMYYINRRAIVLTDLRIILLQINSRRRPRELRSQLRYPSIAQVARSLLGNTKIKLQNGKTHLFTRLPKADQKYLGELVRGLQENLVGAGEGSAAGIEDLCPHCYQSVAGRPSACPACRGAFKDPRKAGLLSLLFPGFGDFYIGHRKFAILEMALAALIWLGYLAPDPNLPRTTMGLVIGAVVIVVLMHGIDALSTWYIARKGLYPAGSG